jgi:Smg protein
MKDNLFDILMNLFESSLTQIQKNIKSADEGSSEDLNDEELLGESKDHLRIKPAHKESIRVFTQEERVKLTKASYQFLMRMRLWNVLDAEMFELIVNQLYYSESRIVTLQETKWTIRNILATSLHEQQLTFLDLVLYQKEDELTIQ